MPTPERAGRGVVVALAAATLAAGGWALANSGAGLLPDPQRCTARVDGHAVAIDAEQAHNAALIAAVAVRRGLPARAVSIALATAYQESDIRNLDHGDRDSLGIFQQRPSQGWGSQQQVMDPAYATNRFYDALAAVDGYQDMAITDAAQAVQRSAYGGAYAYHEADARTLASALTGYSPAAFSCIVHEGVGAASPRALRAALRGAFGQLVSMRPSGRSLEVSAATTEQAWAVAAYLVANADRLAIRRVMTADRVWSAGADSELGWRSYDGQTDPGVVRVAMLPAGA